MAISTLITAALFNPLRRRVQRMVDRRFNRSRYNAEAVVAGFTGRLRQTVDFDAVREVASLMGIRTNLYVTGSWALGTALSGIAAILVAPSLGLEPTMMDQVAVFAFAAAIVGGFGSLIGAVVGGFLIGVASNLIAAYVSTNLQLTLIFAVIVAVLYVRPDGLFGRQAVSRQ